MKKKSSIWAYYIIGSFVIFTTLMISFAFIASHHKVDLVITDYYKAEIEYQKQIEKENNFKRLAEKPTIKFDSIEHNITIVWPIIFRQTDVKGSIYLYRPDKPDKDLHFKIISNQKIQKISSENLLKGKYILKMDFVSNDVPLFIQQEVYIK